jgi:hypothetical protein
LPVKEKGLESPNGDDGSDKENVSPKSITVAIPAEGELNLSIDARQPGCIILLVDSNLNPLADVDVVAAPSLSPGVIHPTSAPTPVEPAVSPANPVPTSKRGV